jgi:hypothetical protein
MPPVGALYKVPPLESSKIWTISIANDTIVLYTTDAAVMMDNVRRFL